jgi:hypothetical protein
MERLRGKTIRYYFSGLIGLSGIQQGKNFGRLSRSDDALREFNRVLKDWGDHARDCGILTSVRAERERVQHEIPARKMKG